MLKYLLFCLLGFLIPLSFTFGYTANNFTSINQYRTEPTKHIYVGDDLIATVKNVGSSASIHYVHGDHLLGSQIITNPAGNIEEISDYYPFGKIRLDQIAGSFKEQRKFTGHTYDQESDLTYAKARYYDGKIGKFLSQDPAVISVMDDKEREILLSNPQNLNSYSYALNNPLKYVDPDGEKVELVERRVPSTFIGVHTFLLVTPDHPDQVSIKSLPANTNQFTIGGYGVGGFLGIGNKLEKDIGFIGDPTPNPDLDYLTGEKAIIGKTVISPPIGQTDSEFINTIGKQYESIQAGNKYFSLGQKAIANYGNSNNFIHELSSRSDFDDQVGSPWTGGLNWAPGLDRGLSKSELSGRINDSLARIRSSLNSILQTVRSAH